ncbi:MAG: hypothetical protein ABI867_23420 [Kofleriaceae bacterium]
MAAPRVKIVTRSAITPGQPLTLGVELELDAPLAVTAIDIWLRGREGWTTTEGRKTAHHRYAFIDETLRAVGKTVVPPGLHVFSATFQLPDSTPPTHVLDDTFAELCARAVIRRPMLRVDLRCSQWLEVRLTRPGPIVRTPLTQRSGDDRGELEVGLASTRMQAGERLVGAVVARHVDDHEALAVTVQLTAVITTRGYQPHEAIYSRAHVIIPPKTAGMAVPFHFVLPTMLPSFRAATFELAWRLQLRLPGRRGLQVSLPLEIVEGDVTAGREPRRPPAIGDQRVERVFTAFAAARGWQRRDDLAVDREFATWLAIERTEHDATLDLAFAASGVEGTVLVGRISGLALGLGLEVDRKHAVKVRFPEQAAAFLARALPAVTGLATLVRCTDDEVVVTRVASTVTPDALAELATGLAALAAALALAREAIGAPPGIVVDGAAWRTLASSLHGRFAVGGVWVDGTLDRVPASAGIEWERTRPARLVAILGDDRKTQPLGESPVADVQRARAMLDELHADLLARTPATGPYR